MSLDPDSVDEDLVVARIAGTHALPLDDGRVLLDRADGGFLVVSPTGALVWECLDGSSSLGEICRDLADVLGAPVEAVLDDTVALVRRMADFDLVRDARAPITTPESSERFPITQHGSRAGRVFDADPWGAIWVRVGDEVRGLGVSDERSFDLARAAVLPERLLDDAGNPDLRLIIDPTRGRVPGMHSLYHDGRCVLRATGEGRMLRAALLHLAGSAGEPEGTVRLPGRVLVGTDGVTVLVGSHLEIVDHATPRLGRSGWRVLDAPGALVDVDTQQVVVPPPGDFLDLHGLGEIDRRFPLAPSEGPVSPGRYDLRNLVAVGLLGSDDAPTDRDSALQALLAVVASSGAVPVSDDVVRCLAGLVEHVEHRWLYGRDHRELLDLLERLAR